MNLGELRIRVVANDDDLLRRFFQAVEGALDVVDEMADGRDKDLVREKLNQALSCAVVGLTRYEMVVGGAE